MTQELGSVQPRPACLAPEPSQADAPRACLVAITLEWEPKFGFAPSMSPNTFTQLQTPQIRA
jgi:hypothetical protein